MPKVCHRKQVIWRHALRNALNPVITAITGWFAELLAGAFFVEYIFGWKGIGKITVDALAKLDFPVVMGSVLVTSFFFICVNILADWLYRVVDPRLANNRLILYYLITTSFIRFSPSASFTLSLIFSFL